jgi:L-amino acid N-acyltransferase YncA
MDRTHDSSVQASVALVGFRNGPHDSAGFAARPVRAEAGAEATDTAASFGRRRGGRTRRVAVSRDRHVPITVRQVQPEDAEAIAGILNPIITAGLYTALDTPFSVADERRFIEQFPPRGIFHVAVLDGRVVGFQNVEPFAAYTHAFDHVGVIGTYVDLALRRQGIASRLFAATFDAAPRKGYEKLFAFVRSDNPAALQTYRRHGFDIIGVARRHARIGGHYVDEVLIEAWVASARRTASRAEDPEPRSL